MWASIFNAVTSLATTMTILFSAMGRFANAIDSIGKVAEGSAGLLADESEYKRELRRRELMAEQQKQLAQLAAPVATVTAAP